MDIVIGSGPAGLSTASALLARGRRVTMLDGGKTLPPDALERKKDFAQTPAAQWSDAQKNAWRAPQFSPSDDRVHRYGSNHAQETLDGLIDPQPDWFAARASHAVGGFSNVWGSAVLPNRQADIEGWPITADQPRPSAEAYSKLNTYLRSGGLILFDTRDADVSGFGTASANGRKLQQLAAPLDVPRLEPVPDDHVLTRTFYLLQDFPGRHTGRELWVEAAPPDAENVEGMPFRNLNDGVTPVVIGGNDWAAAWAVNDTGAALLPIGRGFAGERQRELAYRFGINLIMHVLTGNYKSDQVHVPALLDRLGQ